MVTLSVSDLNNSKNFQNKPFLRGKNMLFQCTYIQSIEKATYCEQEHFPYEHIALFKNTKLSAKYKTRCRCMNIQ